MSELLAPAGNIESLDAAIGEGADAVYLGLKSFNARMRTSNFAWNQFEAAVYAVHKQGKKIYLALNTIFEERETERLYGLLSYIDKVGPDGIIVQDYGVIRMCQEFFPNIEIHASTQMNVESAAAANLLYKDGVKRVVLARELGLNEIAEIKKNTSAELEIFVHGALCVSESGLCLFSSFLGGKSANRGMCTQACRRYYTAQYPDGLAKGYYFSPCDLQLIQYIPDLMDIGVDSFKIEGRMKSAEYVGSVVAAYRYVIDHCKEDKKAALETGRRLLASDFARTKSDFWYGFKAQDEGVLDAGEKVLNPDQAGGTGIYLGKITRLRAAPPELIAQVKKTVAPDAEPDSFKIQMAHFSGGSYDPEPGDSIRIHSKDDTGRMSHKVRSVEIDEDGTRWVDIPLKFDQGDSVYLLQIKSTSKRYSHILPQNMKNYNRQVRDETLPLLDLTPIPKNGISFFPDGIYTQVSSIQDVFFAQSLHPVRLIIEYNSGTRNDLILSKTVLPISKKAIFISLDPFCSPETEKRLAEDFEILIKNGYNSFVVNNIAHIALLKGKNVNMIAGPYLYTFNRWSASWLENQSIGAFIMPYENSRKNLEASFDALVRQKVLIPVFAYPALFRMRFALPASYDFDSFTGREDEAFKVVSSMDGSVVMPELPFSILDKIDFLANAGFKKFLVDFSHIKLSKSQLKSVSASIFKKQPLPGVSRFNWKNGFYSAQQIEMHKASNEKSATQFHENRTEERVSQKRMRTQKPHPKNSKRR